MISTRLRALNPLEIIQHRVKCHKMLILIVLQRRYLAALSRGVISRRYLAALLVKEINQ